MKPAATTKHGRRIAVMILLLVSSSSSLLGSDTGVSLGPALILVQDVKPGQRVDLGIHAKVEHGMTNHGQRPVTAELAAVVPSSYDFKQFDCGYEPPASAEWFTLRRGEHTAMRHLLELKTKRRETASLVIEIPDKPENWNRHFVVYVEGGQPTRTAVGTTLRMRARILLETAPRAPKKGEAVPGGVIAAGPALIAMQRTKYGFWTGSTRISNNDSRPASLVLLRLRQVYAGKDSPKGHRFFRGLPHAVLNENWATGDAMAFELAPGRSREVRFTAPGTHAPELGGWKDEVFFIGRLHAPIRQPNDDAEDADRSLDLRRVDGRLYDRMELLRLRYARPRTEPKDGE